MSRKSPKKYKIYKYNYTCNRLPKKNLLKKSSKIDFSSGDILTSKKSRFQRILNRVRGKKKREISPSYFITPCYYVHGLSINKARRRREIVLQLHSVCKENHQQEKQSVFHQENIKSYHR